MNKPTPIHQPSLVGAALFTDFIFPTYINLTILLHIFPPHNKLLTLHTTRPSTPYCCRIQLSQSRTVHLLSYNQLSFLLTLPSVPEDPFVENTPSTNAFDLQGTGEEESSTSSSDSPTLVDMSNRYVPPSGAIPSGLREVLDATSRTPRDSSVTSMPPLESPQPNRTFQSQLHHIENTMNSTKLGQGGSKNGTSISSQSSTNKHPGGGPVHHRSQGSSNPMRGPGTQSQGLVLHRGQGHRGAQNPNSGRNNLLSAGPSTEMGVHVSLCHFLCLYHPSAKFFVECKP